MCSSILYASSRRLLPINPEFFPAAHERTSLMKRLALALALTGLASVPALAQTSTWKIDPAHSELDFSVKHMSVSTVHGRFGGLNGAIQLNEQDPSKSSVSVTIDANTVDTGVAPRDTDLKSASWFDVQKFPTATFTSTQVSKSGSGYSITGDLTLHGVTKQVVLNVEPPTGPAPGMDKKPHMGYTATTTINRKDFGIGEKMPDAAVSEQTKLTIELEVVKQ
jgi:polyisoprenoid-binding protein YceI